MGKLPNHTPTPNHTQTWGLTQTSPTINGIFEELPVEIIVALIDTLPSDVAELILIISGSFSKAWTNDGVPKSGLTHMMEQVYETSLAELT